MRFSDLHTPDALLEELGRRIERLRLARDLARRRSPTRPHRTHHGATRRRGKPVKTGALIKVLGALDRLDILDAALPERVQSPRPNWNASGPLSGGAHRLGARADRAVDLE